VVSNLYHGEKILVERETKKKLDSQETEKSLKNVRFKGTNTKWVMIVTLPFRVCYDTFFLSMALLTFLLRVAPRNAFNLAEKRVFFFRWNLRTSHIGATTLPTFPLLRIRNFRRDSIGEGGKRRRKKKVR
jgi:hypothetical protein